MVKRKHKKRDKSHHPLKRIKGSPLGITFHHLGLTSQGEAVENKREKMRGRGEQSEQEFQELFGELQEQVTSTDPILMLSWLSVYGLTIVAEQDVLSATKRTISQHEVELIQALALQHKREEFKQWNPHIANRVHELAKGVMENYSLRRMRAVNASVTTNQIKRLTTLELMRLETQFVRNWGYEDQIQRIVTDVFLPLDDEINQAHGVRVQHLVQMLLHMVRESERRLNQHFQRIQKAIRAKSLSDLALKYHQAFPDLNDTSKEIFVRLKEMGLSIDEARVAIIQHSDLRLPNVHSFSLEDFSLAYPEPVSEKSLRSILDNWALSFGDLASAKNEYFFMDNPIWRKPLIVFEDSTYFCPLPGLLYSFQLQLMESAIALRPELVEKYESRRGKYLEEVLEGLFRQAFPKAQVFRGSLWDDPVTNKQFENDLLVLLDRCVIVVEAKAGKVTETARRGAERSLATTIDHLQVEASRQANRFAAFLQAHKVVHQFSTTHGSINQVDCKEVDKVIRLNCILENLSTLSVPWAHMKEAGFIPEDVELVPTISLADLEIVLQFVETPAEKLHYLARRAEFEANVEYFADEMDLLTLYIDTGFNIGPLEFSGHHLNLYGVDSALRPYFLSKRAGKNPQKPHRELTKWWKNILAALETHGTLGWTLSSLVLLNASYDEQMQFEQEMRRRKTKLRGQKQSYEEDGGFVLRIGPSERGEVLIGLVTKKTSRKTRNEWIQNLMRHTLGNPELNRGVVIACDVENTELPYSVAAFFRR